MLPSWHLAFICGHVIFLSCSFFYCGYYPVAEARLISSIFSFLSSSLCLWLCLFWHSTLCPYVLLCYPLFFCLYASSFALVHYVSFVWTQGPQPSACWAILFKAFMVGIHNIYNMYRGVFFYFFVWGCLVIITHVNIMILS